MKDYVVNDILFLKFSIKKITIWIIVESDESFFLKWGLSPNGGKVTPFHGILLSVIVGATRWPY